MSKSRKKYFKRLGIYTLLLLIAAAIALSIVWKYAKGFEVSQVDNVLDAYMDEINSTKWNDSIKKAADKITNEFQGEEDTEAAVKDFLKSGDVTYTLAVGGLSDDSTKYALSCAGQKIGTVTFAQDKSKSVKFDLYPWEKVDEEFNFEFLKTDSDEVVIPETYTLKINGKDVGEEYITETGIKYDVLEPYYADYKDLPTKVKYEIHDLVGDVVNTVYDANGNEFTEDPLKTDIQYMEPCSDAETAKIAAFMDEAVEAYMKFFGTKFVDSTYPTLQPYLMRGTELWDTAYEYTLDAATWVKTFNVEFVSKQFNYAFSLGGGFYVASETCHTIAYAEYKTVDEESENVFVLFDDPAEGLKIVSVA